MRIVALSVPLLSAYLLLRAGDRHWIFCDIRWKSSEPHFACIVYFCSWCRVGLCSKHVQHSLWSISQPPCMSLVMFLFVVTSVYQPKPWGYYFYWLLSLLRGCYAYWMIVRCPGGLLKSLGTVPEVAVSLSSGEYWLGVCPAWTMLLTTLAAEINRELSFRYAVISSR